MNYFNQIGIILSFSLLGGVVYAQDNYLQKADSVVETAKSQLGVKYKYATSNPGQSFDCSGFLSYVYGTHGIQHSRSSKDYGELGEEIALGDSRKGDCLVFSGTDVGSTFPGHVGMVISNNEDGIKFIHCSSSKNHFGVVISDYYTSNYPARFLQVRRLF